MEDDRIMEFTGERFVPGQCDEALTLEHMNRYRFAARLAEGRRVLDIACGTGYGAEMLAARAASVVGVDISEEAVAYCRATCRADNLRFLTGSVEDIPLDDGSVDMVVSFETLEHVGEAAQRRFMEEVRRVLAPDGLLLISTPNQAVYDERGDNEFHVHELSGEEFDRLLGASFKNVARLGQGVEICNLISDGRAQEGFFSEAPAAAQMEYFLAVCSDGALPPLFASAMPRTDGALKALNDWAGGNDRRVRELSDWGRRLDREIDRLNDDRAALSESRNALEERVRALEEELNGSRLVRAAVRCSKGLGKARQAVVPSGSRRALVARYTLKFLRHPMRMIRGMDRGKILNFRGRLMHGDDPGACAAPAPEFERTFEPVRPPVPRRTEDYAPIALPVWEEPAVSIVIPVYNQFEYTYACVQSVLENTPDVSYEVIVADDGSTDATAEIGRIIPNARAVRNAENLRFLRNCNGAATQARGRYILFLNNDTQVRPGWLGALTSLMDADETIGMAGSKLVFADGRLQEAGGILWRDGRAWNYGRLGDPEASEYNYVRETDYISGAAVMIRADLWRDIGGFDERYAPAYNEDSDLAFEVRKRGYKVMYQPKSVVIHFEGVSNGTDPSSGQKAYQTANVEKFREKWKDVLEREHYPNGVNVFQARDRSRGRRTILVIDHYVPQFDRDAGSRTVFAYLKLFVSKGMNVKFIGDNFYRDEPYTTALQQMGIEVLYGPYWQKNWEKWLRDNGQHIDYVMLNRPHIAVRYVDALRQHTRAKLYYYGHDLHYLREKRRYEATGEPDALKASEEWLAREKKLIGEADESWYPSEVEVEALHAIDPSLRVRSIPAYLFEGSDPVQYRAAERRDVMFLGGFAHTPNVDAARWLHDEIWPLVKDRTGDMRVFVIGSKPPQEVLDLNGERFVVTGPVSDEELDRYYHTCRMAIVPLRYGAGIKGKVVEAMYHRLPVLTTSTGAEGIDCDAEALPAVDDAAGFAEALVRLYGDERALNDMSARYDRFIREVYSREHAAETLSAEFDGWEDNRKETI